MFASTISSLVTNALHNSFTLVGSHPASGPRVIDVKNHPRVLTSSAAGCASCLSAEHQEADTTVTTSSESLHWMWSCSLQPGRISYRLPDHGPANSTLRNPGLVTDQNPLVAVSLTGSHCRNDGVHHPGNIPSLPGQVLIGHRTCSSKSQVVYPVNLMDRKAKVEIYLQLYTAGHWCLISTWLITGSSIGSPDPYTHDHLAVNVIADPDCCREG
ncbi:hypothetical protein EDB87DRAFT_1029831 [Lactarius vividus]|nr:hypothetical protein EDB87DRAFT_1029831 [Lactarius vividus]